MQPVVVVYVIIAVPFVTPETAPDEMSTVAIAVLLLLHVPPLVASLNVVVLPAQTVVMPVIGAMGFTVTVVVAAQPVDIVYVIAVVPADTPDTIPDPKPIVAIAADPEVHVPPVAASLNNVMPY